MKILILANNDVGLYKFRRELIEALLAQMHDVVICLPYGDYVEELVALGCEFVACDLLERHGTNPFKEIKLIHFYKEIVKKINPDMVFTYTIKPNVYGGMVCGRLKIPYVVNVTGLGTAVENRGLIQKVTLALYKLGLKKAQMVFFQNKENQDYMLSHNVIRGAYDLLPGSGVNIREFEYMEYPNNQQIIFVVLGRLMKDKGTDEIIEAARIIKSKRNDVVFNFIGDIEETEYKDKVTKAVEDGIIEYKVAQPDVRPYLRECNAIIHASYHEGMSNVLLEAAASGRPIIATDVPGCVDTYIPNVSGISFKERSVDGLICAVEKFLSLSLEQKRTMGIKGRQYMEKQFDRNIVIEKYMEQINRQR